MIVLAFAGFCLAFVWPSKRPAEAKSTESPPQSQSTHTVQQTIIGRDCQQCHRLIVQSFPLDAHGKSARFLKDSRGATCEACHGNSDKHAETSTKTKSGAGTVNPANLTNAQANESCLQCHSRDRTHFEWRGGQHDRSDMSCLSCHNVHHSKLLARISSNLTNTPEQEAAEIMNTKLPEHMLVSFTVEDTCLSCHSNRRSDFFKRSTHLFRTELRNMKVGCASCHNPHGGEGGKMLLNHTVNDLCYTCHAEKRGPFLWDHPPVRENCMNCHSPHGSNNAKLLTARAHMSCQQCHVHMLPRHSTTAGKPLDIWSLNRGCVNCHSQVHGSNHPGGRTLTR
ncbi:MAG: DmsE family decaheme c-type cytochrome [Pyrinomonadaceae bacterium]